MVGKIGQWIRENAETSVFLAYLLLTVLCFFPLLSGTASLNWDASDLWLPWKHFISEELYNGQLPLWNPYQVDGFPQQGDSMTWYPLSWIFGFLNGQYNLSALNQEYLFHILICGLGFYHFSGNFVLSRKLRFLLGLSYMFSGFTIGNAQHVAWVISAAWLPWVFHYLIQILRSADRRALYKLALTGFLFFSGGYLAIFFVTLYILVIALAIHFYKKRLQPQTQKIVLYLLIGFGLIFLLSLPLLLSAWNIFPLFNRFDPNDPNFNVHTGSTPLNGLLAILLPLASGIYNMTEIEFGSFSAYLGLVPVLLLCFSIRQFRQAKILVPFLLALFFLLCSLGDLLPLREWIARLPLLDLFRYPALFRLFFIFFLLISAGVAADTLPSYPERKTHRLVGGAFLLLFLAGLIFSWSKADFNLIAAYFRHLFQYKALENLHLYDRALLNLTVLFVTTLILLFSPRKKLKTLLFICWGAEIIFVAATSAPHTVYHPVNVSYANELLSYQPQQYPQQHAFHRENETNGWQGYLYFSWQGKTMFLKQWSKHGYNPLKLKPPIDPISTLTDEDTEKLPVFSVLALDGKTHLLNDSLSLKVKAVIKNNHDIRIRVPVYEHGKGKHYILVKQHLAHGWRAKVNDSFVRLSETPQGFILVPIQQNSKKIQLSYNTAPYWITFVIFLFVFAVLLLLIVFRAKHRHLLSLSLGVLLLLIAFNNRERWSGLEPEAITQEALAIGQGELNEPDLFRSLAYWQNLPDELLLLQDYPKRDADIAYFRYFFPEKLGFQQVPGYHRCTRYGKASVNRKLLYQLKDTLIGNNFNLDLRSLIKQQKQSPKKLLCLKLIYKAPNATELSFWLAQLRQNKWVNGEDIALKNSDLLFDDEAKIIIRYFDLSRFQVLPEDELRFYAWCGDAKAQAKIQSLELSLE